MTLKIRYVTTPSFERDLKKLSKKLITLSEDIDTAKRNTIELFHLLDIDNSSIVEIQHSNHPSFRFYKLRKFACRSLKGRGVKSGIRIIYAYNKNLSVVTFIEIYFKSEQANEDKNRIEQFLKEFVKP